MCGIAGYSKNSPSDIFLKDNINLKKALNNLLHRGPDNSGIFEDNASGVALAHSRLSILDLSELGNQPMYAYDKQLVIVFNGEIYNFQELKSELELKGYKFLTNTDTEVLLNIYLNEGESMLSRLNGIFAFAIWNKISKKLFIARDALGVKPLYYYNEKKDFFFSSEIKSLLMMTPEITGVDEASLQRYLTFNWCPHRGTPLRSVSKFLPGEAMIVFEGQIERQWSWYKLPVFRTNIKPNLNFSDAIVETRNLLRKAVHRQMIADVPIGAFLSGGLDSSAVVALAREKNSNIRCFTIEIKGGTQEDGFIDDLPYAKNVAKYLKVPLDIIQIEPKQMAYDLERIILHLDEPISDPASLNVLYISELARQKGIKVLLSGIGGDDLFAGYRRHRALMFDSCLSWFPSPLRHFFSKITKKLDQRRTLNRRLAKFFNNSHFNESDRLVNYFRWINLEDLKEIYTNEFKLAILESKAEEPILDFLKEIPPTTDRLERMLALEQRFFLSDHNLIYTDKMSMAAGVEVRVPFLDLDLINFAGQLPNKFKQFGGQGKWILKKAMESYLPKDVIYRSKSGFGAPLRKWIFGELNELVGDLLSHESLKKRGFFKPLAVQKMILDNKKGKIDSSYTIFSLLCIEIWCRNFIDKKPYIGADKKS